MAAGAIKMAIGDFLLTFVWVFCASTIGLATSSIAGAIGVDGPATLLITTALIATTIVVFDFVGALLGGATFNPTATAAFYAAGVSNDSLFSMALRFPAQAAGAVGGAMAIMEVMPKEYKHMIEGPSLKVNPHTGAVAEAVLTFLITLAALVIIVKVPSGYTVKTCLLSVATMALVVPGSAYTGPSMNPANAFGWAYVNKCHDTWEHLYVFWISPFVGALAAAVVFRALFPQRKKKKQPKKSRKVE
ncbi:hypothetical protein V2J09_014098 [Rumex salicifolius]